MYSIPQMHVGRGQWFDGVTLFPVWTDAPEPRGLVTGAHARVSVRELDGGATVPHVAVANDGTKSVLLLEGELLEGGLQHRMLINDLILAPHARHIAEVACVEQGRWGGAAHHGRQARRAPVGVRHAKSLRDGGVQGRVWQEVSKYETVAGSSATASLVDYINQSKSTQRAPMPRVLPGQRGVMFGIAEQPLALELFGSSRALAAHLSALVEAAQLDALRVGAGLVSSPTPGRRARRMARFLDELTLHPSGIDAGDGHAFVAETSHAHVSGVAVPSGPLAHVTVINTRHPILEAA